MKRTSSISSLLLHTFQRRLYKIFSQYAPINFASRTRIFLSLHTIISTGELWKVCISFKKDKSVSETEFSPIESFLVCGGGHSRVANVQNRLCLTSHAPAPTSQTIWACRSSCLKLRQSASTSSLRLQQGSESRVFVWRYAVCLETCRRGQAPRAERRWQEKKDESTMR